MAGVWWIACALAITALIAAAVVWPPLRTAIREARLADARRDFHAKREWLEAKFVTLAGQGKKPELPGWADCQFDDDVAYVRSRATGELSALVAITVAFEEEDGGGSACKTGKNLRCGTAVFRLEQNHRKTQGVTLHNQSPAEAIRYYHQDLEIVAHELARPFTDGPTRREGRLLD